MKQATTHILIAACLLVPFSSMAQQLSHDTLVRRAAFALNTTPDKVRVFDRQTDANDILRVNFRVERDFMNRPKSKLFQCYIVTIPGKVSDARCVDKDGTMDGVRCDPMSKAMNRCGNR